MSTNDPYEQHHAAFGAELRRVTPQARARRRRRVLAMAGTTVALAGAVTAAVVIAPTTGSRLDVLSEAQAAIDQQQDSILHYAVTFKSTFPESTANRKRNKGCTSKPVELWKTTAEGPERYRVRIPLNRCMVNEDGRGRIMTGAFDIAYADGTSKLYSEGDGFMNVTTGLPAGANTVPFAPPGDTRLTEGDPNDPVARIRSLLAEGKLTDAGTVRGAGGRTLRRLVGHYTELRGDPKAPKPWPVDVDYRVDAETFAPVTIKTRSQMSVPIDPDVYPGPTVHRRVTDTTQFAAYEMLPMTPENERLLTVQPKPGTEVSTMADDQLTGPKKPTAAERARAQKITDAQIKAGIRLRTGW